MTSRAVVPVLSVLAVGTFCGLVLRDFGVRGVGEEASLVWVAAARTLGARNVVASIVLGVRLIDTLVEVLVFTTAVLGVRYFLELPDGRAEAPEVIPESRLVTVSASVFLPLVFVIGAYVTVFGHLSPGGGFSGGAIAASGLLLAAVAVGAKQVDARFHESTSERIEWGALVALFVLGLVPVVWGRLPLTDLLPAGTQGRLASGGTILSYNLLIGVKVLMGSWVVIHHFLRHRGEV